MKGIKISFGGIWNNETILSKVEAGQMKTMLLKQKLVGREKPAVCILTIEAGYIVYRWKHFVEMEAGLMK